jgi:hypothetical protein
LALKGEDLVFDFLDRLGVTEAGAQRHADAHQDTAEAIAVFGVHRRTILPMSHRQLVMTIAPNVKNAALGACSDAIVITVATTAITPTHVRPTRMFRIASNNGPRGAG